MFETSRLLKELGSSDYSVQRDIGMPPEWLVSKEGMPVAKIYRHWLFRRPELVVYPTDHMHRLVCLSAPYVSRLMILRD